MPALSLHQSKSEQSQRINTIKLSIFDVPENVVPVALIDVVMNDTDLSEAFNHTDHTEQVKLLVKNAFEYFFKKDSDCRCTIKTITIVPYLNDLLERMKDREDEPVIKKKNGRIREMVHIFDALNAVKPILVKIEQESGETACFICEESELVNVTTSINLKIAKAQ